MIIAAPGASFESTTDPYAFATGLAGTVGVRILDNAGGTTSNRTTANIVELVAGTGIYSATSLTAPGTEGQYSIYWDDSSGASFLDDLLVHTPSDFSIGGVIGGGAAAEEYLPLIFYGPDGSPNGSLKATPGTIVITQEAVYVKAVGNESIGWIQTTTE